MEQWAELRREHFVGGKSIKELSRATGLWGRLGFTETVIYPWFFGVGMLESGGVVGLVVVGFVVGWGEHPER